MAFIKVISGPYDSVDPVAQSCPEKAVLWTIQVKNGNLEDPPNLDEADLRITIGGAQQEVTTDDEGYITLIFDEGEDLSEVAVSIEHVDNGWTGDAGEAGDSGLDNVYMSDAELTGTWKIRIRVMDRRPQGVAGAPIALRSVAINLAKGGDVDDSPRTGANGQAYAKDDLECCVEYTISIPEALGAIDDETTAAWDDDELEAGGDPIEHEGASVKLTDEKTIVVTVERHDTTINVDLLLRFPKLFIAGEGPAFPYAIQLAKKYAVGGPAADRNLGPRAINTAPATVLSSTRKWVLASQYDVHAPPGGRPENLVVYRDAVLAGGMFNVRVEDCWNRLTTAHGDDFEAVIFNNPHPGYGMHMCDVFGLTGAGGLRFRNGMYISVHSIGWGNTLTPIQIEQFRLLLNKETPAVQRTFLQTTAGCVRDGNDELTDFDDGGDEQVTIGDGFTILIVDQGAVAFTDRVSHYRSKKNTTGLWASVLRNFRRHGPSALRSGGTLELNGSTQFQQAIADGHLDGFNDEGGWSADGTYYGNYRTNFTSDRFHPSYFSKLDFNPHEPPLSGAHCYRWTKP